MSYEGLSVDELNAKLGELDAKRIAIREEMRAVRAAINRRLAVEQVEKEWEQMSDEKKRALEQVVKMRGFSAGSEFGKVGG